MVDGSAQSEATTRARRAALGLTTPGALPASALRAPKAATTPTRAAEKRDRAIFIAFAVMIISVTCLQCFGIPISADANVAIVVPITAISLAALCFFAAPKMDPVRIGLYVLFIFAAGGATGFFADTYSPASLALLVVLYAPLAFAFPTSDANYNRCLNFFSNLMVGLAAVEFAQHATQLVFGPLAWPDIYKLLPKEILIPGFNYLQPLVYHSHFDKPQAFVFLEVSFLSQYLALALAIEIVMFRRLKRVVLFTAALFATFAGTGILLIAVALPVLIGRMSARNMLVVMVLLLVVAGLAGEAGWLDTVGGRIDEFQRTGASANHRFIEPFERMISFLNKPGSIYSGIGAGQIEKTNNHQFWPIAKAMIEYGVLTGLLFYAYVIYTLFDRPPVRALAFTLLVWFTFEGSLLTAVNPITCMLLSSLFVIERGPTGERRKRSGLRNSTTAIEKKE